MPERNQFFLWEVFPKCWQLENYTLWPKFATAVIYIVFLFVFYTFAYLFSNEISDIQTRGKCPRCNCAQYALATTVLCHHFYSTEAECDGTQIFFRYRDRYFFPGPIFSGTETDTFLELVSCDHVGTFGGNGCHWDGGGQVGWQGCAQGEKGGYQGVEEGLTC